MKRTTEVGRTVEAPAVADLRDGQVRVHGADQVGATAIQPTRTQVVTEAVTRFGKQFLQVAGGDAFPLRHHAERQPRIVQHRLDALADPVRTFGMVAERERVSTRYLQKLFTEAGNS